MEKKNNKYTKQWIIPTIILYAVVISVVLFAMCAFFSSCSPKITPGHDDSVQHKDSTSVVVVTKDSLVYVPIPLEKDQVIVHPGDTSRLETSVAWSIAFVGGDGFLHHSLENKSDEKLPVVVPITSKTIYTGVTHNETHAITRTVEVEKPLSWWQSLKIGAFPWLLAAVALLLLWTFRKQIVKLWTTFI